MLVLYSIMVKSLWQIRNFDLSCQNADIVQFIFQDAQVFGSKAYPFNTTTIYQLVTATTMQLLRQYLSQYRTCGQIVSRILTVVCLLRLRFSIKITYYHIRIICYCFGYKFFNHVLFHPIVRISMDRILACRMVNPCLTCNRYPAILLVYHLHTTIFRGIFVTNLSTIIRRTVIHQDDFDIAVGLRQQAVYALMNIFLRFIDRNDDRN